LVLSINGRPLPLDSLAEPVAVTPGSFELAVQLPQRATIHLTGTARAGKLTTFEAAWKAKDDGQDKPPAETRDFGGVRTGGVVLVGLGVAGLAAFAWSGSMAKREFSALEAECGQNPCLASYADRIDKGRRLQTVANASLVVGGAAAAAGVAMIIFGEPGDAPSATASLALQAYPLGATLRLQF
jgi:hypothetical protein